MRGMQRLGQVCFLLAAAVSLAAAQDSRETKEPDQPKFRGRLPAYFSAVVDREQREKIYEIQEEYHKQIMSLKAEIDALAKERSEREDAVLTAEQLEQVKQKRAAAKKLRRERASSSTSERKSQDEDE